MPILARDTSCAATTEFGMRSMEVVMGPGKVVEIMVTQRVAQECEGEIQPVEQLVFTDQLVSNDDLAKALCAVLNLAIQSNPQGESFVS